jgi:hypothetical protein
MLFITVRFLLCVLLIFLFQSFLLIEILILILQTFEVFTFFQVFYRDLPPVVPSVRETEETPVKTVNFSFKINNRTVG